MQEPQYPGWKNIWAVDIQNLLDETRGGVDYPHLHEVYTDRLRNQGDELSRCPHKFDLYPPRSEERRRYGRVQDRTDSRNYQERHFSGTKRPERRADDYVGVMKEICGLLRQRFDIYGLIGSGTFGTIFVAREKDTQRHFALKAEIHRTEGEATNNNIPWIEPNGEEHFIPVEAIVMKFLSSSDRFPVIDSVYTHHNYHVIVMNAVIDYDPARDVLKPEGWYGRYFSACTGNEMIDKKKPRLTEIQVCKVASQILEAMMYLMDMHMSHGDLSHNNFVVDESLDTRLLDFGIVDFALDGDRDFWHNTYQWIPYQEYQITPELAIELKKPFWDEMRRNTPEKAQHVHLPHDRHVCNLWKFGVLVYDLLHGYCPWEEPEWNENIGSIRDWLDNRVQSKGRSERRILERRDRIINGELPIDENLSQDCIDVLRAMLTKDINKRPTLRQLASFPWFQGHWVDHGPFTRPARKEPLHIDSDLEYSVITF